MSEENDTKPEIEVISGDGSNLEKYKRWCRNEGKYN